MTAVSGKSQNVWSSTLKSVGVGFCVFYLGRELAVWLTVHNVHGFLAFFDNVAAGIATGLMVLLYERRRQRALDKLRESEQRFRLLADTAPVLIWMSGTDKLCTYFNKGWLDFTGRSIDAELGNGWADGVHPEDLQRCLDTYSKSFDRRDKFKMEYRLRRHDGEHRWIFDIGVPRYTQEGSFAGYIGSCIDITERMRAEEARFRHAAIVESTEDAIISKNLDAVIVSWNAGAQRIFGYTESEAVGQPITILVPPELWDEENQILERLKAGGRIEHYETTRVTKAGRKVAVSLIISPIKDSTGRLVGFCKLAHDITERKRAEQVLQETNRALKTQTAVLQSQEELLKIFVKHVPAAVAMLDRDMRYLQVSDRWCLDFSLDSSQLLGRSHYEIFPEIPDRWKQLHRRALSGETFRAEEDPWDRKGGTTWLRWEIRPWQSLDGLPGGLLIFSEDITRRKQIDEALSEIPRKLIEAQEQERSRIGRELHDDIGQRLAMAAIELQELHEDPLILPEVRNRMGELEKQTSEIATDIQSLSHELHSARLEYLGIAAAMRGFCREFGEHQKVEIDFQTHDLPSPVPPDTALCFFRVLQEALHNSAKYSGVRRFEVRLWGTSDEIHLTVVDSGVGFDREATKERHGLGLISMEERLRLVNGRLSVESQPKRGTTVHACVPFSSISDSARAAAG